MSDQIKKFLARLSAKDLERVSLALQQLVVGNLDALDLKPIKGKPGYIRVRVGRVRIICRLEGDSYEILHITNRNEKTYKNL